MHDIENYNKNGVFFHERNKVYEYEQIQSNSVYRGVRDIDFPIKGNVYENSADYYRKRNISQSELNKTKENWNNKRIEREEREHKVLNDIKRVKNITVFDKKFDSFWLNELDVEVIGSKRDKLGNTILTVNDDGNNLNKRSNQELLKEYNKNGIILKNGFVGTQASSITSLYEYERLSYSYPNEYTDFGTTAIFYGSLRAIRDSLIKSAYDKASIINRDRVVKLIENEKESITIKFKNLTDEEILEKMNEARDKLADRYKTKYGAYGSGVKYEFVEGDEGVHSKLKNGTIMSAHSTKKQKAKSKRDTANVCRRSLSSKYG